MKVRELATLVRTLQSNKTIRAIEKNICGDLIGQGCYRDVYVLKQNPDYVVKIERDPSKGAFANVLEYRNWMDNKEWKTMAKFLAPCLLINETGQVLIQRRISRDGKCKKDYPKEIPIFFTDLKYKNFGWIGDQFVCCDYSFFRLGDLKMSKAKWWGTIKN